MHRRTFVLAAALAASARTAAAQPRPSGSPAPGAAPPSLVTGPSGGFAFLAAPGAPFSLGVVARPGFILRRVRLRRSRPLEEGLAFAFAHLEREGMKGALAACELRSPAVITRAEFDALSHRYVGALKASGLVSGDLMPAARSNMAPLYDAPTSVHLHAFTYAAPGHASPDALGPDFLISGKPEEANPPQGVIAPRDVSSEGMAKKAEFVVAYLKATTLRVGGRWEDINGAHIYSRHPLGGAVKVLGDAGLARFDLALVPGDPPAPGRDGTPLDFEVDVRAVSQEIVA